MARLQTMFFISEALIGIVHRCRLAIDVVCAEFGLLLPVGGVTEFYLIVLALCLLGEVNRPTQTCWLRISSIFWKSFLRSLNECVRYLSSTTGFCESSSGVP